MNNPGTNLRLAGVCRQSTKLTMPLLVLLAIYQFGKAVQAQYSGGTGEPDNPYLIYTAEDVNEIGTDSDNWDKHFKLMADIDLAGITYSTAVIPELSGTLDGNGFAINNLTIVSVFDAGLIGTIQSGGKVCNLRVVDANVACTMGDSGILVFRNRGDVTNCYSTGTVSGTKDVGGLVGDNLGNVSNCYSTGSVNVISEGRRGRFVPAGGLVGSNGSRGTVTNCYSNCSVSGRISVGGFVGSVSVGGLVGDNFGNVSNCYSTGTVSGEMDAAVSGEMDVGGLVGRIIGDGNVINSFWDMESSGLNQSAGGTGKTKVEMKMASTFTEAGWDFVDETENGNEDIWRICEGVNYPRYVWQIPVGDFVCPDGVTMVDFSLFATHWLDYNCDPGNNYCDCTDIDASGKVDFNDLRELADNWLAEGMWILDIIVVDDFESYNDLAHSEPDSNRIYRAWLDGNYNPAANGSVIGHDNPPFAEQSIVHGGGQSMPYYYNTSFKFSKAELPLSPPQDWTEKGVGVLSLWFCGDKSNTAAPMSVILNGVSAVYHDNLNAARIDTWTEWTIDLEAFTGVYLTNINSIAICLGGQNNPQPGGSGIVYFDDIRLYQPGCR